MSEPHSKMISLQELPELRRKTETVAKLLRDQLTGYLETLRTLFAPDRVLGKLAGGRTEVPGAERALTELQQKYKAFENRPWGLSSTFDNSWLTLIGTGVEVQAWEYAISVSGQSITMTSPVKWALAYQSSATLPKAKTMLAGHDASRLEDLRQTVVNALVLQLLLARNPGLGQLFRDLRFEVATEQSPDLPGFPITTITSCLTSFRPADELIATVTAFSGVPSFIELIDAETIQQPRDILREKLQAALG
jgi:hypothetical protein